MRRLSQRVWARLILGAWPCLGSFACTGGQSGDPGTPATGPGADAGCPYALDTSNRPGTTTDAAAIAERYTGSYRFPVTAGPQGPASGCSAASGDASGLEVEITPRLSAAELGEKPCGAAWIPVDLRLVQGGQLVLAEPAWLSEQGEVVVPRAPDTSAHITLDAERGTLRRVSGLSLAPAVACCLSPAVQGSFDPLTPLNALGALAYTAAADYSALALSGTRTFDLTVTRNNPRSSCGAGYTERVDFRLANEAAQPIVDGTALLTSEPCSGGSPRDAGVLDASATANIGECENIRVAGSSTRIDAAGWGPSTLPSKLWLDLRWQTARPPERITIDLRFGFALEPDGVEAVYRHGGTSPAEGEE
jgi:hypothetical protein